MKKKVGLVLFLALLFSLYPQSDAIAAARSKHGKTRSGKRARARAQRINPAIGVYVQTLDGETLLSSSSEQRFNPASVVKIATSFAALEQLGYDYRFGTSVYMDGDMGKDGVLEGNLVVAGTGDPGFFTENAFLILERLHSLGIRSVSGDLVIVPPFYFNFESSATHSAAKLQAIFEGKGSTSAWERYLNQSGREWTEFEGITFSGHSRVEDQSFITDRMGLLMTHLSEPLSDLLKKQNDFSNNFMAEAVGRSIGGPHAIERFLIEEAGLSPDEVHISTSSGLGVNWITPKSALQLFRRFYESVNIHGRKIEDLLPVAGVDPGTLENRFVSPEVSGSVVAKTGTLLNRHASALVGLAYTRDRGIILFAILNRDYVPRARQRQDELVNEIINECGGPKPRSTDVTQREESQATPEVIIFQGSPNHQ